MSRDILPHEVERNIIKDWIDRSAIAIDLQTLKPQDGRKEAITAWHRLKTLLDQATRDNPPPTPIVQSQTAAMAARNKVGPFR